MSAETTALGMLRIIVAQAWREDELPLSDFFLIPVTVIEAARTIIATADAREWKDFEPARKCPDPECAGVTEHQAGYRCPNWPGPCKAEETV